MLYGDLRDARAVHKLLHAHEDLSERGLTQSASWVSQMYVAALGPSSSDEQSCERCQLRPRREPPFVMAKSFFDARQYRRAAAALAHAHTPHARFLRMYALFLAGEKRKEEERQELADWTEPVNMELDALREQFLALRVKGKLDAHLWYLFAVVLKHMRMDKQAVYAFEQSLSMFPYNWGAWLEFAPLCENADVVIALDVKQEWLKALFLAHFYNETDEAEAARQIYENMLEAVPKSAFVKGQLALALYNVRGFDEAQQLYDEIYTEDPYCLDGIDIYSNILYVKEDKVQLSLLANRCMKVDKFRLETCCVIGNYYSLRGQHNQAVIYFQRALKLNRNYLSAWTLMGHEFLEMKNASAAVEAYRRAVDINPKDFRAWYGLGQTYELLSMPLFTLYYYQKAAALRPKDVRMWCAIGQTYEELSKQDAAIKCYERARTCDDQDSLALAKLAYLYEEMAREALKDGRQQELGVYYSEQAAQYHQAILTRRDREKLTGPETVIALKFLAEHYFARTLLSQSEKYCHRLMDYPGPDKDFAKKVLRKIHRKEDKE